MTYSQDDEETVISQWFGNRTGRFLDIGAWNPTKFSNTRALYERGWSGVMVDASAYPIVNLIEKYRNDDRITIVHCAISDKPGLMKFFDSGGDGISSGKESFTEVWKKNNGTKYTSIWVVAITPADLLKAFPGPYPLISIDAEGMTFGIFEALRCRESGVEMVIMEHDNEIDRAVALGMRVGFKLHHKTPNNVILVRA